MSPARHGGLLAPFLLLLLLLPATCALHVNILPGPAPHPSISPDIRVFGPRTSPAFSPRTLSPESPGILVHPPSHRHHRRSHHAPPPSSSPPPEAGCSSTVCPSPMSSTPIGSPCGCVLPLSVIVDIDVAPYLLFMHTAELEVEVAAGTFLKQSQVKIMAAIPSIQDDQKTRVTFYLVPLREHFDTYTAYLISDRFWNKKVQINSSVFGDYDVINITYPGLGPAPPAMSSLTTGPTGSGENPITANVNPQKKKKFDTWIIVVVSGSSLTLIVACTGLIIILVKWRKLKRLHEAGSPAITPAVKRRYGGRSMSTSLVSSASASMFSTVATCAASVKTFSLAQLEKGLPQLPPAVLRHGDAHTTTYRAGHRHVLLLLGFLSLGVPRRPCVCWTGKFSDAAATRFSGILSHGTILAIASSSWRRGKQCGCWC